ncbi:MAG: Hsp33 family molecular chaperone HslO [Clostridia bacterium]|nr:Hsp33 family molecular chaperone HslO [Clostridia bacterium]
MSIQEYPAQKDSILHILLADGMVRGLLVTGTRTVQESQRIHGTTPVVTAALGRTLMGTAMLGSMLKEENASVTVTITGGGPIGKLLCVGDRETVRGCVDMPQLDLPLRQGGKLNVGLAVGSAGRMSVVKDMGLKTPYIGQVPLVSGEIGEDFASYYLQSEQSPSLVSLGVLVAGDIVLAAGGVLLQPLPGCPDSVIDQLELRSPLLGDISRELAHEPAPSLMRSWFHGLEPVILQTTPLSYCCSCSRERMEKALIAMGREELTHMIEDDLDGAELSCHFCKSRSHFSTHDLIRLLNKATR